MAESHEVQLVIYDLSAGMAKSLSAQFLGPQHAIDIIPHTGIIVYGREFFFGGGIQSQSPQQFRQMAGIQPIQIQSLGSTSVPKTDFDRWCREATTKYSTASYDLLQRNCNHFSHDAALQGLKLSQGVPQWILDVPNKFLSSPMGQMVRPLLENMQVTGSTSSGAGATAPFANVPTNNFSANPPAAAAAAPVMENPWANIPSKTTNKTEEPRKPAATSNSNAKPVLDTFRKPLVSSDSKTVVLCVKKLVEVVEQDAEKQVLEKMGQLLAKSESVSSEQVEETCRIILKILKQQPNKVSTFALMFLRVLVLKSTEQETSPLQCLEWIETQLSAAAADNGSAALGSHAARAMAWTCLSNAASLVWWKIPETLITDAALVDLSVESQPRAEVRQAVAAFLYNAVLKQQSQSSTAGQDKELSDVFVSILCATMEDIGGESDATAQLRRVLVGARILVPEKTVHPAAKTLMQDLGFQESLEELLSSSKAMTGNAGDATKGRALAQEVCSLLHE
jgi:hypothetical protein